MNDSKDIIREYQILMLKVVAIAAVLFYPIGMFHELGHYLVGFSAGSYCEVYWWMATHCSPAPQPVLLYFAMGGIFGIIGSSIMLLIKKIRLEKGLFIGVTTIIFSQVVNLLFETFTHSEYLHGMNFKILAPLTILMFLFFMLRFYSPNHKKESQSSNQ